MARPDPPLLNHHGVHEPTFLRAVVRLRTEEGLERLGVSLDEEKLAAAAEAYTRRGANLARDDVSAMRERDPGWLPLMPKW